MKKNLYIFGSAILVAVFALTGCKEDDSVAAPDESVDVPATVFPLTAGRAFIYSGYMTNAGTEEKVANSDINFYSQWTILGKYPIAGVFHPALYPNVAANIAAANNGITEAILVMDTTYVDPTLAPGKTPRSKTPVFAYYDTTNKAYYYMTNLGLTFRDYNIKAAASDTTVHKDSMRFIKLADVSVKTGVEFTCFTGSYKSYNAQNVASTVDITIKGKFEAKESRTVKASSTGGDTTFTTYRLVVKRNASLNGTPVLVNGLTAKIWLADKVGPVEMFLAGDREANGTYRKLARKTF